jgi:hypothetical protein
VPVGHAGSNPAFGRNLEQSGQSTIQLLFKNLPFHVKISAAKRDIGVILKLE